MPPRKIEKTHSIRTMVGSASKYSAMPEATPAIAGRGGNDRDGGSLASSDRIDLDSTEIDIDVQVGTVGRRRVIGALPVRAGLAASRRPRPRSGRRSSWTRRPSPLGVHTWSAPALTSTVPVRSAASGRSEGQHPGVHRARQARHRCPGQVDAGLGRVGREVQAPDLGARQADPALAGVHHERQLVDRARRKRQPPGVVALVEDPPAVASPGVDRETLVRRVDDRRSGSPVLLASSCQPLPGAVLTTSEPHSVATEIRAGPIEDALAGGHARRLAAVAAVHREMRGDGEARRPARGPGRPRRAGRRRR